MHIWVDADACPNVIKDILYRASDRLKLPLTLVANQALRVHCSAYIRTVVVPMGFDVADEEIVRHIVAGDLVITADIPLAAAALEKNSLLDVNYLGLSDRGRDARYRTPPAQIPATAMPSARAGSVIPPKPSTSGYGFVTLWSNSGTPACALAAPLP